MAHSIPVIRAYAASGRPRPAWPKAIGRIDLPAAPRYPSVVAEPEGVHVRSGRFRVDRAEALRKLAAFQLADPTAFVLCWVRAAVASGATRIRATVRGDEVQIEFDGSPWGDVELQEPYSSFFELEGDQGMRVRNLVSGALAAFRLGAAAVRVATGPAFARRGIRLGPEDSSPYRPDSPGPETLLRAEWGQFPLGPQVRDRLRKRLTGDCGMLEPALSVISELKGEQARRLSTDTHMPAIGFEKDGLRGMLFPPQDPSCGHGEAHLYSSGARASTIQWTFPRVQAQAHLDDPCFTLDASQSGVALNARFQEAMQAAGSAAERLLELAIERQERNYPRLTRFLFDGGRHRLNALRRAKWHQDRLLDYLLALVTGRTEEREQLLRWERDVAAWLRETASRAEEEPADPLMARLLRAPLYLSVSGELLSVFDLREIRKGTGVLPACRLPFPGVSVDPPVLWCPHPSDPVIERTFRGQVRWYKDVTAFLALLPSAPAPSRPRRRA